MKDLNSTIQTCAANADAEKALVSEECRGDKPCYFALLDLKPHFNIDLTDLATRYREKAAAVHPDKFVTAAEREKRIALEQSANLNEAYQILKTPSQRARYLLSLKGTTIPLEATVQDPEFLMQQMQWHEELDELKDLKDLVAIEQFKKRIKQVQLTLETEFNNHWQNPDHYLKAEQLVRRMQFMDKLVLSVAQLEEQLDD